MANFYAQYPAVSGGGGGASVGPNGSTAPTSSTEVGGVTPSGNLEPISVDNSGNQNVNVVSSVLPTGAATSANQTSEIAQLTSINGKTPALGQAVSANSVPVVIASDQSAIPVSGTVTAVQTVGTNLHVNVDNFPSTQPVSGTVMARVEDGGGTPINSTNGALNVQVNNTGAIQVGQTLGSNLHTVVDSGSITVTQATGTNLHTVVDSSALPAGAATAALQSNVQSAIGASATTAITIQGAASGVAIPITGSITATNPSVGTIGSTAPTSATEVAGVDTSGNLRSLKVDLTTNYLLVDGSNVTQPISASSLPLPTGAATSALQATGNGYLTTIASPIGLNGAAAPIYATQVAGTDGTDLRFLSTTSAGYLNVNVTNSSSSDPAAGPTGTTPPTYAIYTGFNSGGTFVGVSGTNPLPITASSLPLPTSAATNAALLAVQGSASGGGAASSSELVGGIYNSTLPSITTGQQVALQVDQNGRLMLGNSSATIGTVIDNNPAVGVIGTAAPTSAIQLGVVSPSNGDLFNLQFGQQSASSSLPVVLATDQSDIAVNTSSSIISSQPSSNSMAAANATVQYSVDAGGNFLITLTNGPGATSQWVGSVAFEYSYTGATWMALNAIPVTVPGTGAVTTSSATANGLWLIEAPPASGTSFGTGQTVEIRARMASYTSGTAYFFVAAQSAPNAKILMPWTYTVTSGNTLVGPIEASGISEIDVQISAITTTVYTAQGTNDPTATTWVTLPVQNLLTQGASTTTLSAATTYRIQTLGYKFVRVQCTTTGTVATIQGVSATFANPVFLTNYGNDLGVTINGTPAVTVSSGTITTVSSVTSSQDAIPGIIADVASAAITTTTTTAAFTPTFGSSYLVDIPVTAVSGTSPTYQVTVQESADSGTNWYNVYAFPTITATGSYTSPVITMTGNRVRYVQTLTGTTPSFTRAINRLQSSQSGYNVPTGGILTDASGTTSSTASTSTQILAANSFRKYLLIQNVGTAAIYINFTSAATIGAGSYELSAGGSLVQESGFVSGEPVNVISATASVPFTCKWA